MPRPGSSHRRPVLECLEDRFLLSSMLASEPNASLSIPVLADGFRKEPLQPITQAADIQVTSARFVSEATVGHELPVSGGNAAPVGQIEGGPNSSRTEPNNDSLNHNQGNSQGRLIKVDEQARHVASGTAQGAKHQRGARIKSHLKATKSHGKTDRLTSAKPASERQTNIHGMLSSHGVRRQMPIVVSVPAHGQQQAIVGATTPTIGQMGGDNLSAPKLGAESRIDVQGRQMDADAQALLEASETADGPALPPGDQNEANSGATKIPNLTHKENQTGLPRVPSGRPVQTPRPTPIVVSVQGHGAPQSYSGDTTSLSGPFGGGADSLPGSGTARQIDNPVTAQGKPTNSNMKALPPVSVPAPGPAQAASDETGITSRPIQAGRPIASNPSTSGAPAQLSRQVSLQVYGPQQSNNPSQARPAGESQTGAPHMPPGQIAHRPPQRFAPTPEPNHPMQWIIAPNQAHFMSFQVSQRNTEYLVPPVPGRANPAEFGTIPYGNLPNAVRQKLIQNDELADRLGLPDVSDRDDLVGPIRQTHSSLMNPSSLEPDKASQTGTQRMPHGKLSQGDVQTVVPPSEPGQAPQQSTSNLIDPHSGAANDMSGNTVNRSYVSGSDTKGLTLRIASDAMSGGDLSRDHESLVDALFLGANDLGGRSGSGWEETAATDGSLLTASEQTQRQGPWQKTAIATGNLLFADFQSASSSTAAPAIRDVAEPLAGLLFAWGMTLWPGNRRQQSTILLIESDDAARDAMTVTLVREGFLVLSVATARDALNVLRTPLAPIDLVLLDLDLPDVNGMHLCERMRELFPKLPLMICTGGAEPERVTQLTNFGVQRYLQKPIAGEKLLAAVQASLHSGNPG